MSKFKSFIKANKKDIIVLLVVVLGISIYVTKLQYDEMETMKAFHCKNINEDPTRPDERMCTKGVSLNENSLVFETKGGVDEKYFVQYVEGKPVYIFDTNLEKEEK